MAPRRTRARVAILLMVIGVVTGGSALGVLAVAATGSPPTPVVAGEAPPGPGPTPVVERDGESQALAAELVAPCHPTARVCVQISTQHVWLLEGGRVVRDGFISSGASEMATPIGEFRVQYKDRTHYSRQYRTPMPYAVFFDTQGDALHEGSLGRESAGCVHLDHDTATAVFAALSPGDRVEILA